MKNRKLIIGLLVTLAVALTGATFAYWASVVQAPTDAVDTGASITIGQGGTVTTTVSFGTSQSATDALVPTAYAATPGVEDTSTLTYSITWTGSTTAANGATGQVVATVDPATLSLGTLTQAQIEAMFTITPQVSTAVTVGGSAVSYDVVVVFATEPATQAIYDQVALGTLSFEVTFSVTVD